MKIKIAAIIFHTLLVLSSAVPVKEDKDYRNKEQKLRKQRSLRTDFLNGDSQFASEDLGKLQHTVVSLLESSIGQLNEQVTQNNNRYKGLTESFQEQQQLLRTIADSIAVFHGEFSNFGKRLTQIENMPTGTQESTTSTLGASTSHCGGRLQGESGVISYKEYETYNDGESCTWIIDVPEALKIGFKLEKTGLERCCDHVNVSSLDTAGLVQQAPVKLKSYRTVFVDGPKAMVRFTSDRSKNGLGFRLSYYKITDLNSTIAEETINESKCGGVIVGETGEISYKLDESYLNNERCVWLVHSPNNSSITFNLQDAGFEKCCDFVSVTTIDPETGTLRNDTRLLREHDETVTIQESTAVIVFSSDRSTAGTGFFLKFTASGVNTDPKYVYKFQHIAEPNGTIEYPASQSYRDDDGITKQQHIYVTATSAKGHIDLPQRFISGIDFNKSTFLKANETCVYDSLTFYEPKVIRKDEGSTHVWQKKAQIPNENDTLLCPEIVSVPEQKGLLEFDVHSFLAIYKPIKKDTFESNTTVSFNYYYKPYESLEIVQPLEDEFGIISYKENQNYRNNENYSWIIEVTNATRIDFNLEQNGFEDCCDYVKVTSLDMTGQMQGATLKLRAGSPTASVTGSRALVNFKSDGSTTGSGFRLRYERGMSLDENVCGGILNPMLNDFGVINYKANENYANDENCQWRIETAGWGRIGFNLEQSGFESCCDFVTISSSSVTANGIVSEPVQLKYDNRNISITGSSALVKFTSDSSGTGTGFRLRFEKLPALEDQDAQRDDDDITLALQALRNKLNKLEGGRNQK
ncbi:unnamed protein product [Orchesella dallaii]|uniref:CUB domain-containing protein n=1 Tax=Orchesella dallaii TaxID=48710 RepID=A0ABP1RH44_9HEXA